MRTSAEIAEREAGAARGARPGDEAWEARNDRLRAAAKATRAKRVEARAALDRARRDVRELREQPRRLVEDLGRSTAATYRGEADEEAVREAEDRLDGIERALRRAEAGDRCQSVYS